MTEGNGWMDLNCKARQESSNHMVQAQYSGIPLGNRNILGLVQGSSRRVLWGYSHHIFLAEDILAFWDRRIHAVLHCGTRKVLACNPIITLRYYINIVL